MHVLVSYLKSHLKLFRKFLLNLLLVVATTGMQTASVQAATYYFQLGDPGVAANWNTLLAGGGTAAPNFVSASDIFIIPASRTAILQSALAIGANVTFIIETNATFDLAGQDVTFDGPLTMNGTFRGNVMSDIYINTAGAITGALRFQTGQEVLDLLQLNRVNTFLDLGTNLTVRTLSTLAGTMRVTSGTLTLTINTFGGTNTGTLQFGASNTFLLTAGTLNNNGSISVANGGLIDCRDNASIAGTANAISYGGVNARFRFTAGGIARALSTAEVPTTMPGSVEINNPNGTVSLSGALTINGSFTLSNKFNIGAFNLTLNGIITLNSGASFSDDASGGGTITIGGTSASGITGSFVWNSLFSCAGLTMNRSGQELLLASDLPFTNTGTLSMLAGNITETGTRRVITLNNTNGLVGGSINSFIQCSLRRAVTPSLLATLPISFPVGKGGTYLPLIISDATTGAGVPMLTVEAFNTATTGTLGTNIQSLGTSYWRIDQGTLGDYTKARITTNRTSPPFEGTNTWAMANGTVNATYQEISGTSLISTNLASGSFNVIAGNPRFFAIANTSPVPVITSFTPSEGSQGTVATITGVNLGMTSQVFFGTVPATSFQQLSATQIRATVGAGATGQIRVVTIGGTAFSPTTFAYAPAPVITRVSPTAGGINTIVSIRGRYISSVASITFGGVPMLIISRTDSVVQVICTNRDVTGAIRLGTAGGVATTTSTFSWFGPPQIFSVTPNVGTRRAVLTITGANLSVVDSAAVGGVQVESITVNSPTQVSIAIRDGSTGTVVLRTPAGLATSATIFYYAPIPELRTITMNGEPINAAVGGTTVLLTGDHFLYATRATFGALTGANLTVLSQTQATVQVPVGVTNAVVSIATPGGAAFSKTPFEVQPFVAITGFTPSFGTTGTLVDITGRNFATGASVSIVGSPATDVRVLSTTQILAAVGIIPPRIGRGSVIVTTANGTASSTASFLVASVPPVISNVEPRNATFGSIVVIRGQFLTGVREVTIGGGRADIVQAISATELTVRVTRNNTTGTIALTTIGGTTTSSIRITVIPSPYIVSFSPPFTVTGGTITIRGGNLSGISSVLFGTTPALNFFVQSDSVIIAQLGTGSSGFVRISGSRGTAQSPTELQVLTQLEFETAIVRTLYDSLGGTSWTNRATNRWLSADPVSDWAGITVENGRITQIRLPDNNLRGSMPETLAELQGLRVLDLTDNAIAGTFPLWIARLTSLEELRIGGNQFTGIIPDSIGALSRLRVLVADRNRLTGRIPSVMCVLSNLEELNIRQNGLTGDIASCLGSLPKLRSFDVGENRLTGTIPTSFGNITTLQAIYLDRNQFTGTIPATFGTTSTVVIAQRNVLSNTEQTISPKQEAAQIHATPNLRFLWLNGNQLTGDVPLSFANLANLEELRLDNNRLAGGNLVNILPRLRNLQTLDVGRNQLTGTLPASVSDLKRLKFLALRNNQFSGEIPPQLATLDSLQTMYLDSNAFTGSVSAQFRLMRSLQTFGLSYNRLTTIPGFTSPSIVSSLFVQGNRLQFGDLQSNAFIPNFIYAPQDSVGAARDTSVVIGNPFELSVSVTGRSNLYQWFKNGVEVRATSSTVAFRLDAFTIRDTGSYVCVITNTIMDRLRLVSRPLRVIPVPPKPPTQAPDLVFPQDGAIYIAFAPTFEWTRVDNGVEYEVQVAERRDFAELVTTASVRSADTTLTTIRGGVSGLQPLTQYYWRVRAVNGIGITSPWSVAGRFITAAPNTVISMSSVNFGNTVLGESSQGTAFLTNLTNDDLLIRDVDGNDAELSFRIPLDIRGLTLRAGQTLSIPRITFAPRSVGTKEAQVTIRFINKEGREDTLRLQRVLTGRGTPIKALPISMDTIRFGGTAPLTAQSVAVIVNRGSGSTRIRITSATFTNTATGFSVEPVTLQNPFYVSGGDTTAIIVRCTPTGTGNFTNTLRYIADVEQIDSIGRVTGIPFQDTLFAPLTVFVREERPTDVSLRVGVRPARGQDSVAPGGKVQLELYLLDSVRSAERLLLLGVPLTFSATVRFTSQVLSLERGFRPYSVRNLDRRNRIQRVNIPFMELALPSDQTLVERLRQTGVFMSFTCASVSGDIEQTSLVVEDVRWGIDTNKRYIGEKRVFLEGASGSVFTALACKAGGTRLTTTAKPNSLTAFRPNPVHDVGAISYTVREDGNVSIILVDVLGKVASTVVSGDHAPGEYLASVPVKDLPAGTYFLIMQTPTAILTERVRVVR